MPTRAKKPDPDFVIKLVAPGLRPWDIPVRSLSRVLDAIQRLIEHTEPSDVEAEKSDEAEAVHAESRIRLLGVQCRSAAYPVAAYNPHEAIKILANTGRQLDSPEEADWDSSTLSSIDEISAVAKRVGCDIEIRGGAKDGNVLARITPESYETIRGSAFVRGQSSVYGYLERVGGATQPHCGLRIATQPDRMVICHVASEELARRLGPHVYQIVRVSGMVTWYRQDWRIKSIDVQSFDPVKTRPMSKGLEAIWAAGGKAWDDVPDPESKIKETR